MLKLFERLKDIIERNYDESIKASVQHRLFGIQLKSRRRTE